MSEKLRPWIADPKGHVWEKDGDGSVDVNAVSSYCHNGPRCSVCGYSFCEHCMVGDEIKPCSPPDPPQTYRPQPGDDVWVKAKVIKLRPEREGFADVEVQDYYYYRDTLGPEESSHSETVRLPLSAILPLHAKEMGT